MQEPNQPCGMESLGVLMVQPLNAVVNTNVLDQIASALKQQLKVTDQTIQ